MVRKSPAKLAYKIYGPEGGETFLFVQGLGKPLVAWREGFIKLFTDSGYQVIVFDNRDIGHSPKYRNLNKLQLIWQLTRKKCGLKMKPPYSLEDMAGDAIALLDSLKVEKAHVMGVSMGGMISQLIAILRPDKVLSLTSIMSNTGNKDVQPPSKEVAAHVLKGRTVRGKEEIFEYDVHTTRLIGSPAYPESDDEIRGQVARIIEWGAPKDGTGRQMLAIWSANDRRPALNKLKVPALIIHGDADPLVPVDSGRDTAANIPNAKLQIIEGMGHDLPKELWLQIHGLMVEHARKAVLV